MAGIQFALRTTEKLDQSVSSIDRSHRRARLTGPARAIHFARGDAGNSDFRPLGAPDRAIAVVNRHWRASERSAVGNDRRGGHEEEGKANH
jgi:hypothetical protein